MNSNQNIIISLIRENIQQIDPDAEIILYGSRARGDERKDSDWDILVLTDYPVDIEKERQFRYHIYEVELETGEPISIFVYSKKDWNSIQKATPFYTSVSREGIKI